MAWTALFHLGDLALTAPAAAAIGAWLLASRAWRAALGWGLVFGLALGVVAASKIAFLGWATGLPALHFKAISGHAAGFTTVFPTLAWLLLRPCGRRLRLAGTVTMLALGLVVAAALVRAGEHTAAEAIAGWLVGAAASACAIRLARRAAIPPPAPSAVLLGCALAIALAAWTIRLVPLNYWMIKVALALSGNHRPTPWDHCG